MRIRRYKLMVTFLCGIVLLTGKMNIFAAETESKDEIINCNTYTITDPVVLSEYAEREGVPVEQIEKVEVFEYINAKIEEELPDIQPYAVNNIRNVKTVGNEKGSDYDRYVLPGPATSTTTYTVSRAATKSASFGVQDSLVSANVGFAIGTTYSASQSYTINIPSGQKVTLYVYPSLLVKSFDAYYGDLYQGTGYAKRVNGIIFERVTTN